MREIDTDELARRLKARQPTVFFDVRRSKSDVPPIAGAHRVSLSDLDALARQASADSAEAAMRGMSTFVPIPHTQLRRSFGWGPTPGELVVTVGADVQDGRRAAELLGSMRVHDTAVASGAPAEWAHLAARGKARTGWRRWLPW